MTFDRVASCFDATRAFPPPVATAVCAGIMKTLRSIAEAPLVLEVGVGTGRIAVPLAGAGARILGIDIAPAMLARLREKGTAVACVIADATDLPFRPGVFDAALFVMALHLLNDIQAALHAAARSIRGGGVLLYGRTEHGDSLRRLVIHRAYDLVGEITGSELVLPDRHGAADRGFSTFAEAIGARIVEDPLASWSGMVTGRRVLDDLARRVYSSSWAIPEEIMPELLRRLEPWVESVTGGLDRPVENRGTFTLLTVQLPD